MYIHVNKEGGAVRTYVLNHLKVLGIDHSEFIW